MRQIVHVLVAVFVLMRAVKTGFVPQNNRLYICNRPVNLACRSSGTESKCVDFCGLDSE